jgi:hypothetical protein
MKHTKGKWNATGLEIRHKDRSLILARVYEHNPNNQSREEAEANAQLIAAAPELLRILKTLTGVCEYPYKGTATHNEAKAIIQKLTT